MNRRFFLGTLAAAAAPVGVPAFQNALAPGRLKITAVEFVRVTGKIETVPGVDRQYQANPLHVYDEFRPKPYADAPDSKPVTQNTSALYLRIRTDKGPEGLYGPIDREAAVVVDQQLRPFLLGKDPLAGEALWDEMHRSNRHSRAGHFLMAISAVDNTLWDLRGRYFNVPVWRLLGGPTRQSLEAYASCLGFSLEPESVIRRSRQFKVEGYRYEKWFLAYGPGSGPEGMEKDVSLVRTLREAVGPQTELMFDAFNSWELTYAIAWAKQVEQFRPHWIEEAFPPDKVSSFAELRRATTIPVASGEHFYGRWEVQEYLKSGALNVVQADPEWCGGITELVKICTLASIYDVQVIPHGHSLHAAMHVVASQSPMTCPLVEYLVTKMRSYYVFERNEPKPERGRFALPERPGFGIEFDPGKITSQSEVRFS